MIRCISYAVRHWFVIPVSTVRPKLLADMQVSLTVVCY